MFAKKKNAGSCRSLQWILVVKKIIIRSGSRCKLCKRQSSSTSCLLIGGVTCKHFDAQVFPWLQVDTIVGVMPVDLGKPTIFCFVYSRSSQYWPGKLDASLYELNVCIFFESAFNICGEIFFLRFSRRVSSRGVLFPTIVGHPTFFA